MNVQHISDHNEKAPQQFNAYIKMYRWSPVSVISAKRFRFRHVENIGRLLYYRFLYVNINLIHQVCVFWGIWNISS